MAVSIKSPSEIEKMRKAGRILASVHEKLKEHVVAGISTKELDKIAAELIKGYGAQPSFLDYEGYPASICVSINEEVVHGIPQEGRILSDRDIVSIDIGVYIDGFHSDAARTYGIGDISKEDGALIEAAKQSFFTGIKKAVHGGRLYEISSAIDDYITSLGYCVIEDLAGHGVGRNLHEDPEVPNNRQKGRGIRLIKGMTLAIEPMISIGSRETYVSDNGWTAYTMDMSRAAHYENTILITDNEPEILSL